MKSLPDAVEADIDAYRAPVERSRVRGLVHDVSAALLQQMYFWGCDVRHPSGNLLIAFGMIKLAREDRHSEGTSRYRMPWQEGIFELHGFCAGWYPKKEAHRGVLFVRGRETLFQCSGGSPLTPGHYEKERFGTANREAMIELCRPMLSWIVEYERWISRVTVPGYRERCWNAFANLRAGKSWLPPQKGLHWIESFLRSPDSTPRAKAILRSLPSGKRRAPKPKPRVNLASPLPSYVSSC